MAGAVNFGTARRLLLNFNEEEVLGKTGTCSRAGTRFGWFACYANTNFGRVVVVVFLEGGRPTFGPKAAELPDDVPQSLRSRILHGKANPATKYCGYWHTLKSAVERQSFHFKKSLSCGRLFIFQPFAY